MPGLYIDRNFAAKLGHYTFKQDNCAVTFKLVSSNFHRNAVTEYQFMFAAIGLIADKVRTCQMQIAAGKGICY